MGKIKTLVFAGGKIHDYKGCGQAAMAALSEREEFDLTYVEEDLDVLIAPRLDPYDLIVFYYTVGEITDAQRDGLWHQGKAMWDSTRRRIHSEAIPPIALWWADTL